MVNIFKVRKYSCYLADVHQQLGTTDAEIDVWVVLRTQSHQKVTSLEPGVGKKDSFSCLAFWQESYFNNTIQKHKQLKRTLILKRQ